MKQIKVKNKKLQSLFDWLTGWREVVFIALVILATAALVYAGYQ